jgi:hypothetical protein
MLPTLFALPLSQHFVTAPSPAGAGGGDPADTTMFLVLIAVLLLATLLVLLLRWRHARPSRTERAILVDGSNVIHWQDNAPTLEPLRQVVEELQLQGLKPGVVFDANVGYKLMGRYLGERDLARLLALPQDQIFVVPKGTQADPYLLDTARQLKAQIVTNDRYRDWVEHYPEITKPQALIQGGMRDGRVWLQGLAAREGAL